MIGTVAVGDRRVGTAWSRLAFGILRIADIQLLPGAAGGGRGAAGVGREVAGAGGRVTAGAGSWVTSAAGCSWVAAGAGCWVPADTGCSSVATGAGSWVAAAQVSGGKADAVASLGGREAGHGTLVAAAVDTAVAALVKTGSCSAEGSWSFQAAAAQNCQEACFPFHEKSVLLPSPQFSDSASVSC